MVYPRIVSRCDGGGALFYVPLGTVKPCCEPAFCWLVRSMAADPESALVGTAQLTETYRKASEDQK